MVEHQPHGKEGDDCADDNLPLQLRKFETMGFLLRRDSRLPRLYRRHRFIARVNDCSLERLETG